MKKNFELKQQIANINVALNMFKYQKKLLKSATKNSGELMKNKTLNIFTIFSYE